MDIRVWTIVFVSIAAGLYYLQPISEEQLQADPYQPYKKYCQDLEKSEIRLIFRSKYQVRQFVSTCRQAQPDRKIGTIDIINLEAVAFQIDNLQQSLPQLITFKHRFIQWWIQNNQTTLVVAIDVSKEREFYAQGVIEAIHKWVANQTIQIGLVIASVQPNNKKDSILLNQGGTVVGQDIAIKSEGNNLKQNVIINHYVRGLSSELFFRDHDGVRIWKQLDRLKAPYQEVFDFIEKQVKKNNSKMTVAFNQSLISFPKHSFPKGSNLSAFQEKPSAYYFLSPELELMWVISFSSVQPQWRKLMGIQIEVQSKRYNLGIQSRVKSKEQTSQTKKNKKKEENSETKSAIKEKRDAKKQKEEKGKKRKNTAKDDIEQN